MKTEKWYEAENESTGEVTKYATFDDLRVVFTKIDYGSYGPGLGALDGYKITICQSTKRLFKTETTSAEEDRYTQSVVYK